MALQHTFDSGTTADETNENCKDRSRYTNLRAFSPMKATRAHHDPARDSNTGV